MRQLLGKILIALACAIIMMHACVPHHHHDACGDMGIVFESEVNCHCSDACCEEHDHSHSDCCHHDGDSKHPFDLCQLQELLSHLVLNTKDDKVLLPVLIPEEAIHQNWVALFIETPSSLLDIKAGTDSIRHSYPPSITGLPNDCFVVLNARRGPPQEA